MMDKKRLKKIEKFNALANELNALHAADMAEFEQVDDGFRPPILPCIAIIDGYSVIVDCVTKKPIPQE